MTVAYPHIELLDMYCFIWDMFSTLAVKKYFKSTLKKQECRRVGNRSKWNYLQVKIEHFSLIPYILSKDYSVSHLNTGFL